MKVLFNLIATTLLMTNFSYAEEHSLERLTDIAKEVFIKSTGSSPVYVEVKNLEDADSFNIDGFESAGLIHRSVRAVLDKAYGSKIKRYAALISIEPNFAKHTRLDYLCVMNVDNDELEINVSLDDCAVSTVSNFPVFSASIKSDFVNDGSRDPKPEVSGATESEVNSKTAKATSM